MVSSPVCPKSLTLAPPTRGAFCILCQERPERMGSVHGLGYMFKDLVRGETILMNDLPLEPGPFVWPVPT